MFQIEEVPIKSITTQVRARKTIDPAKLERLKRSIKRQGQLNPIQITPENILIAGERRLRAMTEMGFETITARIMPNLNPDDLAEIELMENVERDDFEWHEEILLKDKLHKYWKKQAESAGQIWGFRETSEKLECAIGGLSSDLKLADAIIKYPNLELDTFENKSQAWHAYKKIREEIIAQKSLENLPEDQQARLNQLYEGVMPTDETPAMHPDVSPAAPPSPDRSEDEQTVTDPNQVETTEIKSEPKAIYLVSNYEKFLPQVPDNAVGFVELDPPYAIDFDKNYGNIGKRQRTEDDWTPEDLSTFYSTQLPIIFSKMLDKSWVLCWTGIEHWQMANSMAADAGFQTQARPGLWIKPGGECNTPKTTMISNYEMFLLWRKGSATFNIPSFKSTVHCNTTSGTRKIHQWEKPFDLYELFFTAMDRPGAIFLSPFAGSGNSMLIAERHNMLAMGCDIRQKYAQNFYDRYHKFFLGLEEEGE